MFNSQTSRSCRFDSLGTYPHMGTEILDKPLTDLSKTHVKSGLAKDTTTSLQSMSIIPREEASEPGV